MDMLNSLFKYISIHIKKQKFYIFKIYVETKWNKLSWLCLALKFIYFNEIYLIYKLFMEFIALRY